MTKHRQFKQSMSKAQAQGKTQQKQDQGDGTLYF